MDDRSHPDIRCAFRSHWAQANHDSRPDTVFCSDLPAVFLDVCHSIIWEPDSHSGCTVQFAWCVLWPDVDGSFRRTYVRPGLASLTTLPSWCSVALRRSSRPG